MYDDETEDYKVKITQANLHVRKIFMIENDYTAVERTLTKIRAFYRYTEIITKTFLVSTRSNCWNHEDIFNRKPVRRFVISYEH